MAEWRNVLSPDTPGTSELTRALNQWSSLRGGKTQNVDMIWFPKPITNLTDMRNKLKVAYRQQILKAKQEKEGYFVENEVAKELVKEGAFTRPGTGTEEVIAEYTEEPVPDKPHISSFRMQNRIFRFLGWTTRRIGFSNQYVVTDRGKQLTQFRGPFPDTIGTVSECDIVVNSLVNLGVFSVNDNIDQWDTRFRQRIVVSLLRVTAMYGYITNNELVVTAFALKDEMDPNQLDEIVERLRRLHDGEVTMIDAFKEVNIDPYSSSAVDNAYDGPKVLLSLCRQTGLLHHKTVGMKSTPYGDLRQMYSKMYSGASCLTKPRVVNLMTDYGRELLMQELDKTVIWFDELR